MGGNGVLVKRYDDEVPMLFSMTPEELDSFESYFDLVAQGVLSPEFIKIGDKYIDADDIEEITLRRD